jgi:hypothetical protein
MTGPALALRSILAFLQTQDCVMRHGASGPLLRLQSAILDLADGRVSPMFKPMKKPKGHPGMGREEAYRVGMAAQAMSLLMEGGESEDSAAREVARELGIKKAATVKNWRTRLSQGPGPGAPRDALELFNTPLEPWPGSTPKMRGKRILELMKDRLRPKIA